MTIRELINLLEQAAESYGDDANVLIMSQQEWPFEYSISGINIREDFDEPDYDEEGEEVYHSGNFSEFNDDQKLSNDIFLIEGSQLRYGNKRAWDGIWRH